MFGTLIMIELARILLNPNSIFAMQLPIILTSNRLAENVIQSERSGYTV